MVVIGPLACVDEGADRPEPPALVETADEVVALGDQERLADYWGSLTDAKGKPQLQRYRALATAYSAQILSQKLGPDAAWFAKASPRDRRTRQADVEADSVIWQRPVQFRNPKDQAKTGYHIGTPGGPEMQVESEGEIAWVENQRGSVDAVHTFEYRHNTMRFGPWFRYPGRPDGGIRKWGGAAIQPVDVARSQGNQAWNVSSAIAFRSGLIGVSGVCTSSNTYPSWQLPPHKVPTAVAVTARNEFVLATVWDVQAGKGQLAVFAMASWTPNDKYRWLTEWDWAEPYPGKHNTGMWKSMKLLGFVDLPIIAPTAIATAASNHPWSFYHDIPKQDFIAKHLPFSEQRIRDSFYSGRNARQVAHAGYAVVISPYEKTAVWIDLQPLFAFFREMYYTTPEHYQATRRLGDGPEEWPYVFATEDVAPPRRPRREQTQELHTPRPVVVAAHRFAFPPSAVLASQARHMPQYSDWNKGTVAGPDWTVVATVDGTLHVFPVSGLMDPNARDKRPQGRSATIAVGRNPVCLAHQTSGYNHPLGSGIYVVSRGDREIQWVTIGQRGGEITRRLRDRRLIDPVHAVQTVTNGKLCPVLTVCDFAGKQVISYRVGKAWMLHDKSTWGCGPEGDDAVEVGHIMTTPGHPFRVSDTNVP